MCILRTGVRPRKNKKENFALEEKLDMNQRNYDDFSWFTIQFYMFSMCLFLFFFFFSLFYIKIVKFFFLNGFCGSTQLWVKWYGQFFKDLRLNIFSQIFSLF
eukprot:TRINITY_DN5729_c0_g1_i1.p10 TRINITY_DN5729_c0_g1~~TRINITY_DN5729_c0_g1_i1.p10  ORF type:complete len:102 (-),score=8.48 TRINITY_DN5729_c0_g1_i1:739-1044(-)